ncbi:MAG: fructose-bisphosphate aldolase [Spirochaetia bacterium]|jgi:transaldolase|nr:fructose-bisphosphate aldolase [Spirochaetia bacterium]
MGILLDCADVNLIEDIFAWCPLDGVVTNPVMIEAQGRDEFFRLLSDIRKLIGYDRELHVQVVAADKEGMIKDAERLVAELGKDIHVEVPVTKDGLAVIGELSIEGFKVTATAVFSVMQGLLAANAGAKAIAVYYNELEEFGANATETIFDLSRLLSSTYSGAQVLATSFKNINQVFSACSNGAGSCSLPPSILLDCVSSMSTQKTMATFAAAWQRMYGTKNIFQL